MNATDTDVALQRQQIDEFVRTTQAQTAEMLTKLTEGGAVDLRQPPEGLTTLHIDETSGTTEVRPWPTQLSQWPAQPAELAAQLTALEPGQQRLSWVVPGRPGDESESYLFSQRSPTEPDTYMLGKGIEYRSLNPTELRGQPELLPPLNTEEVTIARLWHGRIAPNQTDVAGMKMQPLAAFATPQQLLGEITDRWQELREPAPAADTTLIVRLESRWFDPQLIQNHVVDGEYQVQDIFESTGQPRAGIQLLQSAGDTTGRLSWELPIVAGIEAQDVAAVVPGLLMITGLHGYDPERAQTPTTVN